MGNTASTDIREWSLSEVRGLYLFYKDECFDFGLDRNGFEQLLQEFKPGLADQTWKKLDPTNSGLVNALECMAALVVTSKGQLSEKVELLFSLFDLSETNLITYDEMVILATSVLAGMVKITGKGNLPEDANMEKLVDQAFLDADKDLSGTFSTKEFCTWLNKSMDLEQESLQASDVLILFDLLEEPNLLPDSFVNAGYADEPDIGREMRRSDRVLDDSGASGVLDLISRCRDLAKTLEFAEPAGAGGPASLQSASLTLLRTHGCSGPTARNSVVCLGSGEVAYPLACLVVVAKSADVPGSSGPVMQRWYRGHTSEVSCLAGHPDGELLASGELGKRPAIHVWDSGKLEAVAVLRGLHRRGLGCLSFSPSGKYLASVGDGPANALLVVYDWRRSGAVAKISTVSYQVLDTCWFTDDSCFVTVGTGGLTLWKGVNTAGKALAYTKGDWGRKATRQLILSVMALDGQLQTGCAGGQIYAWQVGPSGDTVVCRGGPTIHEASVAALWTDGEYLLSGGTDGVVKVLDKRLLVAMEYKLSSSLSMDPAISGLSAVKRRVRIVVSTRGGEVVELQTEGYNRLLTAGHFRGEARALDTHPSREEEFVTAGDDGIVRLWLVNDSRPIKQRRLSDPVRVVCYSPDGSTLAVGLGGRAEGSDCKAMGSFHLLNAATLETATSVSDFRDSILSMQYSPDGCLLAVACDSGAVYLYNVAGDFASKKCVINALSSPVNSLIFSVDGQFLRLETADHQDVHYVDASSGGPMMTDEVKPGDLAWVAPPDALQLRAVSRDGVVSLVVGTDEDHAADGAPEYPVHAQGADVAHRFTNEQKYLVTVGSADRAVLVWRVRAVNLDRDYAAIKEDEEGENESEAQGFFAAAEERADPAMVSLTVLDHGGMDHLLQRTDDTTTTSSPYPEQQPWRACIFPPARLPASSAEAPLQDLALEWVHGFAGGREVRRGLAINCDGELVYTAGRLGVVHCPAKAEQRVLQGVHAQDPTCLAVNAGRSVVATGQKRSGTVFLWDAQTARLTGQLESGMGEGLVHLAFSGDTRLAVMGVATTKSAIRGLVAFHLSVWDTATATELARAEVGSLEPRDLAWLGPRTLVAVGPSFVTFWKVLWSEGTLERVPGFFGRKAKVQTVLSVAAVSESVAVTGQLDGSLYLWGEDGKAKEAVEERHEGGVECLCVHDGVIYSGGRDSWVKGWGAEQLDELFAVHVGAPVCNLVGSPLLPDQLVAATIAGDVLQLALKAEDGGKPAGKPQALVQAHGLLGQAWGLSTHPKAAEFATAGDDGVVRVWDVAGRKLLRKAALGVSLRAINYSPDGALLVVGCGSPEVLDDLDGCYIVLDSSTLAEVYRAKTSQQGFVQEAKFSADGGLLAVACSDSSVFLYDAQDNYLERGVCKAGGAALPHLDFSDDGKYFQVGTSRHELLYFSSTTCKRLKTGTAQLKDAIWHSFTSVYGWPVQAVWNHLPPGLHVHSLDRTRDMTSLLACGDNAGNVRLGRYPAVEGDTMFNVFKGHSSVVASCRWLVKDSHLITLGARDRAILQWRLLPPPPPPRANGPPIEVPELELQPIVREAVDTQLFRDLPPLNDDRPLPRASAPTSREQTASSTKSLASTKTGSSSGSSSSGAKKRLSDAAPPSAPALDMAEPLHRPTVAKGLPETEELVLEYVHGLRTHDCRAGVRSLGSSGEYVFLAACLAVVEDPRTRTQRFYTAHTDEVVSLAVHPDGRTVATGQVGAVPEVHVWDSAALSTLAVVVGLHRVGVSLLAFSPVDGDYLLTAGQDAWNTLACYNWRGVAAASARFPPEGEGQVVGVGREGVSRASEELLQRWVKARPDFNENEPTRTHAFKHAGLVGACQTTKGRLLDLALSTTGEWLCAVGRDYIRFWHDHGRLQSAGHPPRFCEQGMVQAFLSASYSSVDTCVVGCSSGDLYVWVGSSLTRTIRAHKGPVNSIAVCSGDRQVALVMTGGKDGKIMLWDAATVEGMGSFSLQEWRSTAAEGGGGEQEAAANHPKDIVSLSTGGGPPAAGNERVTEAWAEGDPSLDGVRCLASHRQHSRLLIATVGGELLEWDHGANDVQVLLHSHYRGQLWAVATHPTKLEYATAGDDRTVRVWDGSARRQLRKRRLESSMRALTYSPDGRLLVAGYGGSGEAEEVGAFVVLDAETLAVQYKEVQSPCGKPISDLKFTADASLLIAACSDASIYVYEVANHYNRRSVISGHTQAITNLDLSEDGKYVQSAAGTAELCYFNVRNSKQVRNRASELREAKWATWTLPVGWFVQGLAGAAGPWSRVVSVDRSKDGRMCASLDRHGRLRLTAYPFLDHNEAAPYTYRAHATLEGGTCRWASKDSHVVSVGGRDRVVMQWRHARSRIPPSMAKVADVEEPNSDVELEHPMRSSLQDAIKEGRSYADFLVAMEGDGASFSNIKPWVSVGAPPTAYVNARNSNAVGGSLSSTLTQAGLAPSTTLRLSWVHGYDAQRLRNQVWYNAAGHLVYSVGSLGVVYDPTTHSQRHFHGHTDDVISLTLTDDRRFVASGQLGRLPRICVWDSDSLAQLSLLRGRLVRGVVGLAFTHGGSLLAAIGLDAEHSIAVYDWRSEVCLCLGQVGRVAGKPLCLAFSPDDRMLAVGTTSDMTFHYLAPTPATGHASCSTLSSASRHLRRRKGVWGKRYRYQPVLCCLFLESGTCATGMLDGTVYFWDGPTAKAVIQAHASGPVYSLEQVGPLLLSGGGDGLVKAWKPGFECTVLADFGGVRVKALRASSGRTLAVATQDGNIHEINAPLLDAAGKPARLLVTGHALGPITCLATHPSRQQYATSSHDRVLMVWDAASRRLLRASKPFDAPISALDYSSDGALLAVGLGSEPKPGETEAEINGTVMVLNALSLEPMCKDRRADGWIRAIRFSPDTMLLAAASNDRHIYLYEANPASFRKVYSYRCTCRGHAGPVTHLDFTEDGRHLQSSSAAWELLYWNTATGAQLSFGGTELKDARWATWTLPYGWPVQGLWPEAPDGIDVTSVHRSPGGKLLAAVDDHARLRLYRYPCFQQDARCHVYGGHGSLITNCRWTAPAAKASSSGGTSEASGPSAGPRAAAAGEGGGAEPATETAVLVTTGAADKAIFQWVCMAPLPATQASVSTGQPPDAGSLATASTLSSTALAQTSRITLRPEAPPPSD